jgi:ribosomal protein S18 acetylase RimI-like enzyme
MPILRLFAVINAWQILPPDDRQLASIAEVARTAEQNLLGVLNAPGGTALVAVENGKLLGYLSIAIRPDERTGEPTGYMADIYIDPGGRGKGIATEFHRVGEKYLADMGIRKASLWTHAHNPLGQKSAQRQGYQIQGVVLAKTL